MKNRVITISREFGSGGRTIGKKVAEQLGIPCYDAEIIQEMVKETGFTPEYVKEAGEYTPGSFLSSAFSNRLFGPTNEDILWEHQYKVITELAQKGPCVIVGRCADYILQDKADCLKVFIHADMDFRARRIVEVYGEREQSPEERTNCAFLRGFARVGVSPENRACTLCRWMIQYLVENKKEDFLYEIRYRRLAERRQVHFVQRHHQRRG